MIVKIQIPIMTTAEVPMALIYNEDRSIEVEVPASEVKQLFREGEFKVYAHAEDKLGGDDGKKLIITELAPNQSW
jgi:hypothetical protein